MVRTCILMSCVLFALFAVPSSAYPSPSNYYRYDDGPYEPEEIVDMMNRIENLIQMERKMQSYKDDISRNAKIYHNIEVLNDIISPHYKDDISRNDKMSRNAVLNDIMIPHDKRDFDLGLSRGVSGSIHAKHLMGVEAANFAGGPGRRRRDAAH